MEISDWISISLAILTFIGIVVALFLGLSSLSQTRKIQGKQHRLALLNEIIEWAIDAKTNSWEISTPFELSVTREALEAENLNRILDKYRGSKTRSEYITGIALKFGKDLFLSTNAVVDKLDEVIDTATRYLNSEASRQTLKECELSLSEKATDLIIEATVLKNIVLG